MIMISFNGAVTGENMDMYAALFKSGRVNPNGCSVKGTFFVSHKYTNYSAVTELHRQGHEVGIMRTFIGKIFDEIFLVRSECSV